MKNEMAWATVGRHAAQGVAWALCDIEMCERVEALEAKLATSAPCPSESVTTEPDYESWVGDLVMGRGWTECGILKGVQWLESTPGRAVFDVAFGEGEMEVGIFTELRLATESERRLYTGTPPTEAGQWCMVRAQEGDDWFGPREFVAQPRNHSRYYAHSGDGTWIVEFRFARLATPKELRDAGKDGAE